MTKQERMKEMGRLEVMTKRQAADKLALSKDESSEQEEPQGSKVVKIVSSSWRNIIHDKKQAKEAKLGKEPEPEPSGFFLDFGDNPAPALPKIEPRA